MSKSPQIQYPPPQLIQTWIWMMTQSSDAGIQEQGQNRLIASFGSLAKANEYLLNQQNNKLA